MPQWRISARSVLGLTAASLLAAVPTATASVDVTPQPIAESEHNAPRKASVSLDNRDVASLNFAPTACMNKWDTDLDGYLRDRWESNLVHAAYYDGPGAPADGTSEIDMRCGTELYGIIHTAHEDSTGNVHPIFPADEPSFEQCFTNIVFNGGPSTLPDGRRQLILGNNVASLIYDAQNGSVYTMWANGNENTNNWTGCAAT